jgi:hypothetical protein
MWCVAELDEQYIARMEDVLAVYEKAEYRRCGTANVFCGVQPKAGRHFTKVTDNRSSSEFADVLVRIVKNCALESESG